MKKIATVIKLKDYFSPSQIKKYDLGFKNIIYLKKPGQIGKTDHRERNLRVDIYQKIYLIWVYWSNLVNTLTKKSNRNFEKNFNLTTEELFRTIGLMQGDVLDVGGGCGSFRGFWSNRPGSIYVNHDPNIKSFENFIINEKAERVFFVEGVAENLPYKDNIYDTVLIADALDHFYNPKKSVEEAFRTLKNNGKLIILQCYRKMSWLNFVKEFIHQKMHISYLNKTKISRLIQEAGFKETKHYNFLVPHTSIKLYVLQALKRQL